MFNGDWVAPSLDSRSWKQPRIRSQEQRKWLGQARQRWRLGLTGWKIQGFSFAPVIALSTTRLTNPSSSGSRENHRR